MQTINPNTIRPADHFLFNFNDMVRGKAGKYPIIIMDIGIAPLPAAEKLMNQLKQRRLKDQIPDVLLILSHPPIISVGVRKLNENDLLKPLTYFTNQQINIFKSNRGGGVTYHWPGQLVVYPILKLRKEEQHIPKYMYKLEEVGLRTLKDLGIPANRKRDKTAQIGLWYKKNKIASMGISVSNWVTSYGLSLNLGGDLSPSKYIRPCGLDVNLITVADILGFEPNRKQAFALVKNHFEDVFQRRLDFSFDHIKGVRRNNLVIGIENRFKKHVVN